MFDVGVTLTLSKWPWLLNLTLGWHWPWTDLYGSLIFQPSVKSAVQTWHILNNNLYICLFFPENHRTQTQYDDALVIKLFAFQFANCYSTPFYIAFFRDVSMICFNFCLNFLESRKNYQKIYEAREIALSLQPTVKLSIMQMCFGWYQEGD